MHSFKTVSDIRIDTGGAARLDQHVDGLCANKRIAIITDKESPRFKMQAMIY